MKGKIKKTEREINCYVTCKKTGRKIPIYQDEVNYYKSQHTALILIDAKLLSYKEMY